MVNGAVKVGEGYRRARVGELDAIGPGDPKIHLRDSDLTDEDIGKLIDTLAPTPLNTRELTLQSVRLSDANAVRLAWEVLRFASKLKELNLNSNSIGNGGAIADTAAVHRAGEAESALQQEHQRGSEGGAEGGGGGRGCRPGHCR